MEVQWIEKPNDEGHKELTVSIVKKTIRPKRQE